MEKLLGGHMDLLGLALSDRHLSTLIVCDLFTVWPGLGGAVGALLYLTSEGVGHLRALDGLGLVIPQLLLVSTGHLGDDELDVLLLELALLPGDGLALLSPSPDLLPVVVCLPERDTVLLRDIPTLGEQLLVGDRLLALVAALLDEQLGRQLLLCVLHGLEAHLTLLVRHHFALGLRHVNAHIFRLGLTLAEISYIYSSLLKYKISCNLLCECDMTLLAVFDDPLEVEVL